jgi:hypothetical protein
MAAQNANQHAAAPSGAPAGRGRTGAGVTEFFSRGGISLAYDVAGAGEPAQTRSSASPLADPGRRCSAMTRPMGLTGSEAVTVGTGLDLDGAVAAGGADEPPD